jgi:hypothetical protein
MIDCANQIENGLIHRMLMLCQIGHGIMVFLFQFFFDATVPFLEHGIATLCMHMATILFFVDDITRYRILCK